MTNENEKNATERSKEFGKRLWWLVDPPLFIDDPLVERLHDAVVWPELIDEDIKTKRQKKIETFIQGEGKIGGEADISAPGFLQKFLPSIKGAVSLEGTANRKSLKDDVEERSGRKVRTTERLLSEVVQEYLGEFPDRVLFVDAAQGEYSNLDGPISNEDVQKLLDSPPRPLVFLSLPEKSIIFPTMIEFENGGLSPLFKILENEFLSAEPVNPYPSDLDEQADDKRKAYWGDLRAKFNSRVAMTKLEEVCESDRIGWIDFRLMFTEDGDTAHLHVVPSGHYHAGVFGYNFIHRGFRYGCRIVGLLKAGNDVNVLSIYDT